MITCFLNILDVVWDSTILKMHYNIIIDFYGLITFISEHKDVLAEIDIKISIL